MIRQIKLYAVAYQTQKNHEWNNYRH
jgi:hypothetical protein